MPQRGSAQAQAPDAAYYDDLYAKSPSYADDWKKSRYATLWRRIVSISTKHEVDSILEVGCGTGQLAACFRDLRPEVSYRGFDFSTWAIGKAKKLCPDAQLKVADIRDPDAYGGDHQAVVATEVFEHLDDDVGCLKMIDRGKLVIFSVPNFNDPGHVRYFRDKDDVRKWYQAPLDSLSVTWLPRDNNARLGYWICVGRR